MYGMCVALTCACMLNSSSVRWLVAPAPEDANEYLPGLARIAATNSATFDAGNAGWVTST